MKKDELKKLRTKKVEELRKSTGQMRLEISKILAKIASGQEKNLKKGRLLKRELSQTLTILKEMEIVQGLQKVEEVSKVPKVSKVKTKTK